MKKFFYKTVSMFAVLIMVFASAVGCKAGMAGKIKPKEGQLVVTAFDGGYGLDWLYDATAEFERLNSGIEVKVRLLNSSADQQQAHTNVEAGLYVGDVLYDTVSTYKDGPLGLYLDLSEVYSSVPDGEDKTVREKIGEEADEAMRDWDGKYYSMPVFDALIGLQYNKTSLDSMFPDGWNLPNTTDELYNLCNRIRALGHTPFVYSLDADASYPTSMLDILYRQLVGVNEVQEIGRGIVDGVRDETGEKAFDIPGRMEAIEDGARFFNGKTGMVDAKAKDLSFIQAQGYFWGVNVGQGKANDGSTKLAAFQINGDWNYNETRASYGSLKTADLRFMRMPVSSRIIDFLPDQSVDSDKILSAVVSQIDTKGDELLANAEQLSGGNIQGVGTTADGEQVSFNITYNDFKKIYDARRFYYSGLNQQLLSVPYNCGDFELAKKFLTFMSGDSVAYMKAVALDGISTVYNRKPFDGVPTSDYIKSRNEILQDSQLTASLLHYPVPDFFSVLPGLTSITNKMYDNTLVTEASSKTYRAKVLNDYVTALNDKRGEIEIADSVIC